jgi:hypothetical protein
MRASLLAFAAAGLLASAAVAQTPAPKPKPAPPLPIPFAPAPPAPPPLPEKWEDLPASAQARLEKDVKPLTFQSVLNIQPSEMPTEPRFVEAGAIVALQKVSPMRGVRLTSAPRRKPYGEVGSVLWQARDAQGDLWCRLSDFSFISGSNYYCYRDTYADGVFDQLFEGGNVLFAPGFQTLYLGTDERIGKPVSYVPADPPDMQEVVALRYHGVQSGVITADGKIGPGVVEIELIVGKDPKNPRVLRTYEIQLDINGKGWTLLPTGHAVEIDSVEVGGRARIKVDGGLVPGEGYLLPERNKERLFQILRRQMEHRRANPAPPRPARLPLPPVEARPPSPQPVVPPPSRTPTP